MAFEFPASVTSVSFDVAVVQEIFRRLDRLDAKIDAMNAGLSAMIDRVPVRMDGHDAIITSLEEKGKAPSDDEPVPCIPAQGPFFLLRAYYMWFADAPCRHLKTS